MKQIIFVIFALCLGSSALAQNANLVFFSEGGEKFSVIMNGLRENAEAQTNVKASNLNATQYLVKIIFEDTQIGEVSQVVKVSKGREDTYIIRKSGRQPAAPATSGYSSYNSQQPIVYELEFFSSAEVPEPVEEVEEPNVNRPAEPEVISPPPTVSHTVISPPSSYSTYSSAPQTTTTQSTTTTYTTPGAVVTEDVSMSINLPGFNMGTSISVPDMVEEPMPSIHSHNNHIHSTPRPMNPSPPVYVPGYNGPVGCAMPMDVGSFQSAKQSIASKSFSSSKMTMAKQIIGSNCLTSDQVRQIITLFDFESDRLEFAKFAYGYTYDLGNYYRVNDAFEFESSINQLNNYINGR